MSGTTTAAPIDARETNPQWKRPLLLDQLKRDGFKLTPNYDRALDGRVVDTRFDPETGEIRNVTDHELAGAKTFGIAPGDWRSRRFYGLKIKQVWYFSIEGVELRCNEAFNGAAHFGLQYKTICAACDTERWTNADRHPLPLCLTCRTRRCPLTGLACSTAYKRGECRCDACRAWHATQARLNRAASKRGLFVSSNLKREEKEKKSSSFSSDSVTGTNKETTRSAASWTWLPQSLRDSITSHEAALARHDAARKARVARCYCNRCTRRGFESRELTPANDPRGAFLCATCAAQPLARGYLDPKTRGFRSGTDEYLKHNPIANLCIIE
jgi:hypothetical protein